ncbi:MAG: hypothetical protein AABZ06_12865 [Bdellovibrionota bacterium]
MRTKYNLVTISVIWATFFVAACSFKASPQKDAITATQPGGTHLAVSWTEMELFSTGVRLNVKTMPAEEKVKRQKSFQVPELEEIRSEFSGSFTLYRMKVASNGFEEWLPELVKDAKNIIFIQPKVYVYGTSQGGNVLSLTSNDNKSMSLTFPMAFIDGTRQTLPSYEGTHAAAIPDALKIPDVARLKEDLHTQIGAEPRLMPLTTCPRQMSLINLRGDETRKLSMVPTVFIQNRCPINEFFTATVTSSKEEIYDLVQNGILDGLGVQLQADFRVEYREPVALYSLQLDPLKIYNDLRKQFIETPFGQTGDPTIYFAIQLIKPLENYLRTAVEQTGISGTWVPYFQGVQVMIDSFFERVDPEGGCSANNRCFRLKPELSIVNEPLELQWIEQQTLASTRTIPTLTFVKGLAETYPIRISSERSLPMLGVVPTAQACTTMKGNLPGCDGFSCEKFPDNVYCRSSRTKNPIHYFQVFPGAKIRFSFDRITEWGFELPAPREDTSAEQKRGTIRCADSQAIPGACEEYEEYCATDKIPFCKNTKDECDKEHKLFQDQCKTERVTERSCGFLGLGQCDEVLKENRVTCEKIEVGTECLKWKSTCQGEIEMICPKTDRRCKKPATTCNQWTTEFYSKYTYSEPWVRPHTIDIHNGQTIEELWDGLDLEFSWLADDGKTINRVSCPLKAFHSRVEGYSITLILDNQDDTECQPFNSWNTRDGRWPEIALINHISFEKPYLCGTLEWTRSISADLTSKERVIDQLNYRCPERGSESSDKPIVNTYQPIVDLEGSVSIMGRSMDTVSSMPRP